MPKATMKDERIAELRQLQDKADAIRIELGISPPGRILYQAAHNVANNDLVIVEADGFGGATTSIVEGNYPLDYITKFEKSFETEQGAEAAAEKVADGKAPATVVLGLPL